MKLIRYKLINDDESWQFDEVNFSRVNLLVGDSGTGKTRFVNTIYNFTKQIISSKILFAGDWDTDFEIEDTVYNYQLSVKMSSVNTGQAEIIKEILTIKNSGEPLITRDENKFIWRKNELPKLSNNISAISLLKDEDVIRIIYNNLKKIVCRRFFGNELGKNFQIQGLSPEVQNQIIKKKDLAELLNDNIHFHNKMNLLRSINPEMYSNICSLYKQTFPYIIDTSIRSSSEIYNLKPVIIDAPIFCIKEKHISKWIPCVDISSGMQKTFLLVLDLFLIKEAGILLVDEYENSLGVNAINFLPDLIYSITDKCQFIITSHHPYIINNIPIECWHVFHRSGLSVKILSGNKLKEKYGESRQEHFMQLINDPFYQTGIE